MSFKLGKILNLSENLYFQLTNFFFLSTEPLWQKAAPASHHCPTVRRIFSLHYLLEPDQSADAQVPVGHHQGAAVLTGSEHLNICRCMMGSEYDFWFVGTENDHQKVKKKHAIFCIMKTSFTFFKRIILMFYVFQRRKNINFVCFCSKLLSLQKMWTRASALFVKFFYKTCFLILMIQYVQLKILIFKS